MTKKVQERKGKEKGGQKSTHKHIMMEIAINPSELAFKQELNGHKSANATSKTERLRLLDLRGG